MKFGLFAINYGTCADPDDAVRIARHAEAAGFESVWTGEHIVLPRLGAGQAVMLTPPATGCGDRPHRTDRAHRVGTGLES